MTVVGLRTYACACVILVDQPLSVRCFILVILDYYFYPGFQFLEFWNSAIVAFSNSQKLVGHT